MIKKIYVVLLVLVSLWGMGGLTSCSSDESRNYYEGESFVMFQDSACVMPVTEDGRVFEVAVGMTRAVEHDRYVAVAVEPMETNAIEGYHFELESHNVLIPAGKLTGNVRIKAKYDNIESVDDSLAVTLRILASGEELSSLYGSKTNIRLQKVRPFRIEDYVGDMQITCTFPYSTSSVTRYYVKTEKVDAHTLVLKKVFEDTRDIVIRFHENKDNPLDQNIDVKEQVAFTDERFGPVSMSSVDGAPSYYLPEDRAFVLYLDAYLSHLGSFGSYYYIFQWVTPDEVLADKNGLGSLW